MSGYANIYQTPTILRWRGYKFLFYSLDEGEPPHVHIVKARGEAEFWLADCRLARPKGFADRELNRIRRPDLLEGRGTQGRVLEGMA